MANKKFLLVLLSIALVFGVTVAGCRKGSTADGDSGISVGGGGTFTLTNIPPKYNGKYVFFGGAQSSGNSWAVAGAQRMDVKQANLSRISNGSVSVPTWKCYGSNGKTYTKVERYSGNDAFSVVLVAITDKSELPAAEELNMGDIIGGIMLTSVAFSKGSATKSWNDGIGVNLKDFFGR